MSSPFSRSLPPRPDLAQQRKLANYGFASWAALKQRLAALVDVGRSPGERIRAAIARCDAGTVRTLLERHPEFRSRIDYPVCPFDAPALVACANDAAMVDVLLDFGADPNRRSDWWAGGFHALHSATGAAAERLLAAGATPDACAAAHLDRADLLTRFLADDPKRVHERGGDGQTPLHFARSRVVVDGARADRSGADHAPGGSRPPGPADRPG
ncbi:hypothetical protein BH23GEM9_BH23GEM9_15760 [soil metagenome]